MKNGKNGKKNGSKSAAKSGKASQAGFERIEVPNLPVVKTETAGDVIEGRLLRIRYTNVKNRPATILDLNVDGEEVSYFAGAYVKRALSTLSPERIKTRPRIIIERLSDEEDDAGAIPHDVQIEKERSGSKRGAEAGEA